MLAGRILRRATANLAAAAARCSPQVKRSAVRSLTSNGAALCAATHTHQIGGANSSSGNVFINSLVIGCIAALIGGGLFGGKAENCGIVGVVGGSDDASAFLLEGLTILRNRGYDSAGKNITIW
jgi:hypothetical protein